MFLGIEEMDLKPEREIWAINVDLKHPMDLVKAMIRGESIPEREN